MTGTRGASLSPLSKCVIMEAWGFWGLMGWALEKPCFLQLGGKSEK